MAVHIYLSIITLNVNGLNAPTKRHRVAEWIRKQDQKNLWDNFKSSNIRIIRVPEGEEEEQEMEN